MHRHRARPRRVRCGRHQPRHPPGRHPDADLDRLRHRPGPVRRRPQRDPRGLRLPRRRRPPRGRAALRPRADLGAAAGPADRPAGAWSSGPRRTRPPSRSASTTTWRSRRSPWTAPLPGTTSTART
ncbi:hypothetical protein G5V59_20490 [Nocardioides sp. W3-2-3]|uniref:hypothetical protein n=1 Tax=Nocardioides convexus TaxID=2712224 RepID=UPI0024188553|nr:hypothetical protein [Nocardioides convexus]NHA01409.1 hypothetical protein [Nocardioides convexus]